MLEAVVLSRKNFREYDEMVSLFTKERGKVEVLARGVKKFVSKNAPFLEPFSHINVGVVPGKEIEHLTNVQSLSYFPHIRKNISSLRGAYLVIAFLDQVLSVGQKDSHLFDLLLSWLSFVEESHTITLGLVDSFILKSASFFGFEPHFDGCVVCGTSVESLFRVYFSFENGGVVCPTHKNGDSPTKQTVLSSSDVLALKYFLNRSWREIVAYEIPSQKLVLHEFVYNYVGYVFEKNFFDWDFFSKGT